ncbi:MAG: CDP-glycerol glycerophosphotransferase family protein, partial [Clostridia bacterium]|nr:CDP-glycerol glycerophosphotransferase family protein [Clostridia bacterium]
VLFIIKPHPAQDNLEILNFSSSNIKIIKNMDLLNKKIMLYSLVGQSDILITDYSSIYFDYLLTQKPIGFVIDDIDSYGDRRGFVVENPEDYMAGEKIKNVEELQNFLDTILDGEDKWKEKRREINHLMNADRSMEFSKKILDFVGIKKE